MIKDTESEKRNLLLKICDYCGYQLKIYEKESADDCTKYVSDNGTPMGLQYHNANVSTEENGCLHLEYRNINIALKGWLDALIERNKEHPEKPYSVWPKEIIDFISQLEAPYRVNVRESLVRSIDITATSIEAAKDKVKEQYDAGEIVLTNDDFNGDVDARTYDQNYNALEDWQESYIR